MTEKILSLIIYSYFAVGFLFGLKLLFNIIRLTFQKGIKKTSHNVLGMDGGVTPISLFIFPFFLMLLMWPLSFLDLSDPND
mgnify:CR=1 FL=1